MAHDVFISYSSHDKIVADAVCSRLESRGIRCWMAPRDIIPGAAWAESIIEALDTARVMVLVFSARANHSPQIQREVERSVQKGVSIIPLRIENTYPSRSLEYFISAPHWLDAIDPPLEQHLERLGDAIDALLARASTGARPAAPSPRGASGVAGDPEIPTRTSPTRSDPAWVNAFLVFSLAALAVSLLLAIVVRMAGLTSTTGLESLDAMLDRVGVTATCDAVGTAGPVAPALIGTWVMRRDLGSPRELDLTLNLYPDGRYELAGGNRYQAVSTEQGVYSVAGASVLLSRRSGRITRAGGEESLPCGTTPFAWRFGGNPYATPNLPVSDPDEGKVLYLLDSDGRELWFYPAR